MNNVQADNIAVAEVMRFISRSIKVATYLQSNDKEPIWDGFLYMYSDNNHSSENFIGRIPSQIKGKSIKVLNSKISKSIKVSNLKAYLKEGGVALFVVGIASKTEQIYCNLLTAIDIKRLLKQHPTQKSISISCDLISNIDLFEVELLKFYHNLIKQVGTLDSELIPLVDYLNSNKKAQFNFEIYNIDKSKNLPQNIVADDKIYLYAVGEYDTYIPIGESPVSLEITETVYDIIKIKDTTFFNSYSRAFFKGGVKIIIGNCLFITFYDDHKKMPTVKYTPFATDVNSLIAELKFITNFTTHQAILIGKFPINIINNNEEEANQFLESCNKRLQYWEPIKEMLDILNVRVPLNIKELTDKDYNNLNILYRTIVKKETFENSRELDLVFPIKINNLKILVSSQKTNHNKYKLFDYFSSVLKVKVETTENKTSIASIFTPLRKEGFLEISNIDYSKILSSYQSLENEVTDIYNIANMDLLQMLLAYDASKNNELYNALKKVAEWLYNKSKQNKFDRNIAFLNWYQIILRERQLTESEKLLILDFSDSSSEIFYKLGANILLKNQANISLYLSKLSEEERIFFKTFPIYNLSNVDN